MSSQPEALLKKAIIERLHGLGLFAFRNEQGSRGNVRFGCGVGSPDIFVVLRPGGRLMGLEVKTHPSKKPTVDQIAWGEYLKENGGAWYVVYSVQDAINAVGRELQLGEDDRLDS